MEYLYGSSERKESLARQVAKRDGVTSGLIGIGSVVEPCLTYFGRRDREQKNSGPSEWSQLSGSV